MRKSTFTYDFEELPLVIHNGIEAAFINGRVVVEYDRYCDWNPGEIFVEGFGERDAAGKRQWPYVPAPSDLAAIILFRLEHEWESKIRAAINDVVVHGRECAADDYADMRRDERMGL